MTTAFELGCLSAMEKVAVNSGAKDPVGNRRTSAENRISRELRGLIPAAQPEAQKPVQDLSYTPIGPAGAAASRATADPKLDAVTIPPNSLFPVSPEARAELERQAAMIAARQGQNNLLPYVPGTGKADDGFFSGIGSGLYNAALGTGNFIGNAALGTGNFIGNAAIGTGNFIGDRFNEAGSFLNDSRFGSVEQQAAKMKDPVARHNRVFGAGLPTNAPAVGSKLEPVVDLNNRLYGAAQSPEQRAAQKALDAKEPDVNAQYYENLAKLEAAQNAAKGAPESKSEPTSEPTPQAQGGLASYLKNPYVLGGLGIGALGLGGYGLYNHFNSKKKKKKKESDSE